VTAKPPPETNDVKQAETEKMPPEGEDAPLDPQDEKRAFDAAGTFVTSLTGFATGALVFGIGLSANSGVTYDRPSQYLLVASWVLLALSLFGGIVVLATMPMHIVNHRSLFSSPYFENPIRFQQGTFFLALLALAVVLARSTLHAVPADSVAVPSAAAAVALAVKAPGNQSIQRVQSVELLKGADGTNFETLTWHVQFVEAVRSPLGKRAPTFYRDVFIDAATGKTMSP
jgi:hypothetical protein